MIFRNCRRNCCAKGASTRFSLWICHRRKSGRKFFKIHITKRKRDAAKFDLETLASGSAEFSGAEIEEAVNSALYDAFYSKQELTTENIKTSLSQTVPLAKTMDEQISRLRSWAEGARAMPVCRAKPKKTVPYGGWNFKFYDLWIHSGKMLTTTIKTSDTARSFLRRW